MPSGYTEWMSVYGKTIPFLDVVEWYVDRTIYEADPTTNRALRQMGPSPEARVEFKKDPKVTLLAHDCLLIPEDTKPSGRKILLGIEEEIGASQVIIPTGEAKIAEHKLAEDVFLHGILEYFYAQFGSPQANPS